MTLDQPAKRLSQIARRCRERAYELEQRLFRRHFSVMEDRRHLEPGAPERGYYTAGYLQALQDVGVLVNEGEFPTGKLDEDGGPRIPSRPPASVSPGE